MTLNIYPHTHLGPRAINWDSEPMSEAEFLGRPHPAVVAHTAAVVERVQALQPPSLVKLDRAEALVAAVVIWRNRELHGQAPGEEQYDSALDYVRDLTDKYTETT